MKLDLLSMQTRKTPVEIDLGRWVIWSIIPTIVVELFNRLEIEKSRKISNEMKCAFGWVFGSISTPY